MERELYNKINKEMKEGLSCYIDGSELSPQNSYVYKVACCIESLNSEKQSAADYVINAEDYLIEYMKPYKDDDGNLSKPNATVFSAVLSSIYKKVCCYTQAAECYKNNECMNLQFYISKFLKYADSNGYFSEQKCSDERLKRIIHGLEMLMISLYTSSSAMFRNNNKWFISSLSDAEYVDDDELNLMIYSSCIQFAKVYEMNDLSSMIISSMLSETILGKIDNSIIIKDICELKLSNAEYVLNSIKLDREFMKLIAENYSLCKLLVKIYYIKLVSEIKYQELKQFNEPDATPNLLAVFKSIVGIKSISFKSVSKRNNIINAVSDALFKYDNWGLMMVDIDQYKNISYSFFRSCKSSSKGLVALNYFINLKNSGKVTSSFNDENAAANGYGNMIEIGSMNFDVIDAIIELDDEMSKFESVKTYMSHSNNYFVTIYEYISKNKCLYFDVHKNDLEDVKNAILNCCYHPYIIFAFFERYNSYIGPLFSVGKDVIIDRIKCVIDEMIKYDYKYGVAAAISNSPFSIIFENNYGKNNSCKAIYCEMLRYMQCYNVDIISNINDDAMTLEFFQMISVHSLPIATNIAKKFNFHR